jgi:hypothetical protein
MAAMTAYNTRLMYGETSPDTPITIKDTPVILAKRSSVETTTLSDDARTFIPGIRETSESFDFTCNYDADVFATLNALDAVQKCALVYSDGSGYTWDGKISASVNEAAIDAVLEMTVSVTPTTEPKWSKTALGS